MASDRLMDLVDKSFAEAHARRRQRSIEIYDARDTALNSAAHLRLATGDSDRDFCYRAMVNAVRALTELAVKGGAK